MENFGRPVLPTGSRVVEDIAARLFLTYNATGGDWAMWVIHRDKQYEVKSGSTARDVILKIGLDPEAVLVLRNGKLVDDSAILQDDDEVKLISVVSGG
jgi:sulfur carrier protein ThiS